MDAISFVLGEKTSNLRVKSVKELIHGAPVRRPVASTAHVSAHYVEEKDGKELGKIVFFRKIVGSGTEYRIDGNTVTPKEYQEKLESIGILIKAKNFLVFQGAIESIAMKNPKERTAMFEKISGSGALSATYEEKKQVMQKSEEDTAFTLHKKKGITAEKREAKAEKEEAEKYQKLTQELVDSRLEAQLFRLYHIEREIDAVMQDLKAENKDLEKMTTKKNAVEEQLKSKKMESAKISREQALIEKKMKEKEADLNKKRPLYIKAKEKTTHSVKKLDDIKKTYDKTKNADKKQKLEIEDLKKELEDVQRMAAEYEEQVAEESQGQSLELMGSQMEEYNKLKEEAGKRATALQSQLDKVNRDQRSDEEALEHAKHRKTELQGRHQQLQQQRETLEERLKELEGYITSNIDQVSKYKEDFEKLDRVVKNANQKHDETNQLLMQVQNELNEAKSDKHESARHQKRTEILESLKRLYPGVYGRLIDLCEPVHKRYAVAITKVLGKNMDAVVVDTERTAKDCIQYVKEQRGDRITFLPLDYISVKPVNEQLRQCGGTAKLVLDVIRYSPPQIKKALQYACSNAVVCDTMEEARKLAFGGQERKKTVSLDGTMFEKSGVMSGGARRQYQSLATDIIIPVSDIEECKE